MTTAATKIRRAHLRRTWLHLHKAVETSLFKLVARYFQRQSDEIIAQVEQEILTAELAFPDPEGATAELREVARPPLVRTAWAGAADELAAFLVLDEIPANVSAGINTAIKEVMEQEYWSQVAVETRRRLSVALRDGIDSGEGLEGIVARVREALGPDASAARARRIAITETTGALNAGRHSARQDLIADGCLIGEEWLAIQDSFTRQAHANLDGVTVSAGELFDVGGTGAPYPGWHGLPAKQRINCRCTSVGV